MCIVLCWGLTHELPLPDAKKSPSLEKVTALTDASCPLKTDKAVIVIGSHNRTWCAQVSMRVCAQVGVCVCLWTAAPASAVLVLSRVAATLALTVAQTYALTLRPSACTDTGNAHTLVDQQ
jgi:hypothetical protein